MIAGNARLNEHEVEGGKTLSNEGRSARLPRGQ